MVTLIDLLYNALVVPLLAVLLWSSRIFGGKLRMRAQDEESAFASASAVTLIGPRFWFHAASMGEFEQCVPVIMAVRASIPNAVIIATFTSPSGYRHVLRMNIADIVLYLPVDSKRNARRFLDALHPDVGVIVRYDLWRNHAREAQRRHIPVHVIDATVPAMTRYRSLRRWISALYRSVTSVTAMTPGDAEQLATLMQRDVPYMPDTRFDRILQRISNPDPVIVALQRPDKITVILGSSWPEDEDIFLAAFQSLADPRMRCIIVPHEPTPAHILRVQSKLHATLMSKVTDPSITEHIIVDSVGSLLSLYAIADAAFIGGGFGAGVHSLAEPAGYGLALACGPHLQRSRDAMALLSINAVSVIRTQADVTHWLRAVVLEPMARKQSGDRARTMITSQAGSSQRCADIIINSIS
ncbi:glycosyltransferase N-terminal domain-containing protein [soil metagenome]